jgi:hypothetical protein
MRNFIAKMGHGYRNLPKLSAMIQTYLVHGGKHVQFNVVSRDMLLEAQRNPAQYHSWFIELSESLRIVQKRRTGNFSVLVDLIGGKMFGCQFDKSRLKTY